MSQTKENGVELLKGSKSFVRGTEMAGLMSGENQELLILYLSIRIPDKRFFFC